MLVMVTYNNKEEDYYMLQDATITLHSVWFISHVVVVTYNMLWEMWTL